VQWDVALSRQALAKLIPKRKGGICLQRLKYCWICFLVGLLICGPQGVALADDAHYLPVMARAVVDNLRVKSAVLMDYGTGQFLLEKQADERRPIASITKVMTMLLTLEALEAGRVQLSDEVVASPHACSYGGAQIYLEPGERFTVEEMLMAVTIKSANDAAVALAEHVAGSESAFVARMNQRAQELGMQNTHFINACGLDHFGPSGAVSENGYSSARDVAIMSRALLKYQPLLADWLKTRITYLQRASGPVELFNTNHRLIRNFPGADGLKTGLTDDAGYCLSATAERSGFRLLAVALGADTDDQRYQDITTLLNYGYANYMGKFVVQAGEEIAAAAVNRGPVRQISAVAATGLPVLLPKGDSFDGLEQSVQLSDTLFAPIAAGDRVGTLTVSKNGTVLGEVELIAAEPVPRLGFLACFWRIFGQLYGET
jgi:D-alanyl-D-alanine carboxypeptidase (penicillin-binding protein 5/6)